MCSCGEEILKSKAATAVVGSVLVIAPTEPLSPDNEQRVKIKITTDTPTDGASLPVSIVLNTNTCPLYDRFGNIVYGTEIYKGQVLAGYYGNNGNASAPTHYQLVQLPKRDYCCCC